MATDRVKRTTEEEVAIRNQDVEMRRIYNEALEQPLGQETEMGAVLRTMNEDAAEKGSHYRKVDFLTRLHPEELSGMVVHDALVGLRCLPEEMMVTTITKKRLAVSLKGEGRRESVQMVTGVHQRRSSGFMDRLGSMFRPKGDDGV